MIRALLAVGRGGSNLPLILVVVAIVVALLIAQRKAVKKAITGGRHSWTPDEQRATIRFWDDNRTKGPHEFGEALLKLAKELNIPPNAVKAAVDAVARVDKANGKGPVSGASKQLLHVWADYRGKRTL